jgi:hypothetical protein
MAGPHILTLKMDWGIQFDLLGSAPQSEMLIMICHPSLHRNTERNIEQTIKPLQIGLPPGDSRRAHCVRVTGGNRNLPIDALIRGAIE